MLANPKIAALEFEGDTVRIAVVKAGGRLPTVLELYEATAVYQDPEDRVEALTDVVGGLLARLKGRPASYLLSVSTTSAIVRTMTLPFRGRSRVAAAAQMALEDHLAFPIEELYLDSKIVTEVDGETDVLVMGVRRDQLEEQLAILEGAGIAAESVSLDAVGLTALWAGGQKKHKGLQAILHVREANASLVILYNNNLAFIRHLSATAAQIKDGPASVGREVQNSIRSFTTQWRAGGEVESLHVTGTTLDAEETEALSRAAALPVEATTILPQLKGCTAALEAAAQEPYVEESVAAAEESAPEAESPESAPIPTPEALKAPQEASTPANRWEATIGVAMTARGGRFAMNFNKGENVWEGSIRAIATHLMFASCIALVILLAGAKYYQSETSKNEATADELIIQMGELGEDVERIRQQVQEDIEPSYFTDPIILDVLMLLSDNFPESKVSITDITVSAPNSRGAWLTIKGTTTQDDALGDIIEKLGEIDIFSIDPDPGLSLVQEVTHFTIKAYRIQEEGIEEDES